jgi:CheY-like chemotaxis protein
MKKQFRILVVDDNRAIHDDFRKILAPPSNGTAELSALEDELFGESAPSEEVTGYELTSAYQGKEALELLAKAMSEGRPFAAAFVDIRMPPGWDGVETVRQLWTVAPDLQVVICTAFSDYSWDEISRQLGRADRLQLIRKPFDPVEVQQLAAQLVRKSSPE